MRFFYLAFWGVPCCERLQIPKIKSVLLSSHRLIQAQSATQADLLLIFGHITQKQSPYLRNLFADFVYPSSSVHFIGCQKALQSYALVEDLSQVLHVNATVPTCEIDLELLNDTLERCDLESVKKAK